MNHDLAYATDERRDSPRAAVSNKLDTVKSGGFIDGVRRVVERYGMDVTRPLAMVSGGPDSVAMLRVLLELGGEPVVLHVDHGLRDKDSREDARFVSELCEGLGVECEVRRVKLVGGNLQEKARRERYRLAEEVSAVRGLSTVVTGHTADDVTETVLLNLSRGAGMRGMTGIPPVRGRVARPLISHHRTDVLDYLRSLGQPYRTDLTNLTPKYARNRVRLEVLPVLEDLYPGAARNIARAAALLREDLEALEELAGRVVHRRGEEVTVAVTDLQGLPLALRRHAMRRAYAALAPDAPPLDAAAVERVLALLQKTEGATVLDLPANVRVAVRFGAEISFYLGTQPTLEERELLVGEQHFERWDINISETQEFDAEDAARPGVAYLDAARGPYRVRMSREGDRMRPLGLGGTKKVYRAMQDRKVPADLRDRTPVVVDEWGRVAWLFLGELDESFTVTSRTERMIRLEVRRI